ncbi:dihydrofolate reductase family protein [Microlunatus sp. GCM10028923]|uniref:dihydrofolate reductase family protein n=1 Tax=Microlunatus sp. GCM10028923 TaxID=3273400 RepID=UPI00361AD046
MAKLLYSAAMSLDGFIAGPGGDMSWLNRHPIEPSEAAASLVDRIGCVLVGGTTFRGDDPNRGTEEEGAFAGQYDGSTVVLTRRPPERPLPGVEFHSDLVAAVTRAKDLAGDRYVNVLGAGAARSCLEAGLLDEVLVFVVPVLLGGGTRAYDGDAEVGLERLPGTTEHWYRVIKN